MASKNNITGSSVVPMNAKLRKKKMKKITKPLFQYSPSKMKEALVTILVHKMKVRPQCGTSSDKSGYSVSNFFEYT